MSRGQCKSPECKEVLVAPAYCCDCSPGTFTWNVNPELVLHDSVQRAPIRLLKRHLQLSTVLERGENLSCPELVVRMNGLLTFCSSNVPRSLNLLSSKL